MKAGTAYGNSTDGSICFPIARKIHDIRKGINGMWRNESRRIYIALTFILSGVSLSSFANLCYDLIYGNELKYALPVGAHLLLWLLASLISVFFTYNQVVTARQIIPPYRHRPKKIEALILPVSRPGNAGENEGFNACDAGKYALLDCLKEMGTPLKGECEYYEHWQPEWNENTKEFDYANGTQKGQLLNFKLLTDPNFWVLSSKPIPGRGSSTAKDCKSKMSDLSWQTAFFLLSKYFEEKENRFTINQIYLVPSHETRALAANYLAPFIERCLAQKCLPERKDGQPPTIKIWDEEYISDEENEKPGDINIHISRGVDYHDFSAVYDALKSILKKNPQPCLLPARWAIDVTGGSSSFSAAAAILSATETAQRTLHYTYVSKVEVENGGQPELELNEYKIRLQS